jgi:ankyrin repeat protein
MKKLIVFVLCICFVGLISCGKKTGDDKTTNEKKTDQKVTEKVNPEDFFKAVKDNEIAKVKEYLAKDPTLVKAVTSDFLKETALAISSFNGNKEIVELLLQNGADPNVFDDMGIAPIIGAARTNRAEIIEMLIKNKADIKIKTKNGEETALHYAAEFNSGDAAKILLANGADKTAKTTSGKTPLDIAKDKKSDKVIDLLK